MAGTALPTYLPCTTRCPPRLAAFPKARPWLGTRQSCTVSRATASEYLTPSGLPDYYEILQVDDDASPAVIKSAYRDLTRVCHPDLTGGKGHNICILLNEAYTVLMDTKGRSKYNALLEQALKDADDDYTGHPLSTWLPATGQGLNEDPNENRGVFVDEGACIGCKQCVWCAPNTFEIEDSWGRSRAHTQWADIEDDLQAAIESCPVDCISWVERDQLAALEHVMRHIVKRVDVGTMMGGAGGHIADVFEATHYFMRKRDERLKQAEKDPLRATPMQREARKKAARDLSEQRSGGWFGRLHQVFRSTMEGSGTAEQVDARAARGQVGYRKRAMRPRQEETIPLQRSLVPASYYQTWSDFQ